MSYGSGDIVIAPFSHTDLTQDKNRPVLLIAPLPNSYGDWLGCMITSQLHQFTEGIDVMISKDSPDFPETSLKTTSLIRVTRLMVITEDIVVGGIGNISPPQLNLVITNLASWLISNKIII